MARTNVSVRKVPTYFGFVCLISMCQNVFSYKEIYEQVSTETVQSRHSNASCNKSNVYRKDFNDDLIIFIDKATMDIYKGPLSFRLHL